MENVGLIEPPLKSTLKESKIAVSVRLTRHLYMLFECNLDTMGKDGKVLYYCDHFIGNTYITNFNWVNFFG